jgi:hypothetical protein
MYGQVFFYRSQHVRGRGRVVDPDVAESVWVTKAEMPEYIQDEGMAAILGHIM